MFLNIVKADGTAEQAVIREMKARAAGARGDIEQIVRGVMADVQQRGWDAVVEYAERFDGKAPYIVEPKVLDDAYNACDPKLIAALEKAAAMVVGHKVHITGCGRTDAGVHAKVYVANFRTDARIPVDRIPYAFNTHLPGDIVVTGAMEVHDGFNAIGSCVKKEYTYLIYNSPIKDPFYVNRAWFYPKHLDETVMQRAAQQFVGTHDFAAVRSVGTEVKSTVRTVYHYEVERDGDLISLRVCANGFLYNMARAMAGTVVYAAEGKFPPEEVVNILARGDRKAAGPTVPPGGLYMTQLWYDDGEAVFHVG